MANDIVEKLMNRLGSDALEMRTPKVRRIFLRVRAGAFREAVRYAIQELEFKHLSTITSIDLG